MQILVAVLVVVCLAGLKGHGRFWQILYMAPGGSLSTYLLMRLVSPWHWLAEPVWSSSIQQLLMLVGTLAGATVGYYASSRWLGRAGGMSGLLVLFWLVTNPAEDGFVGCPASGWLYTSLLTLWLGSMVAGLSSIASANATRQAILRRRGQRSLEGPPASE